MDLNELGKNPEQIKQLIALLQTLLPNGTDIDESPEEPVEEKPNPIRSKTFGDKPKQAQENKFLAMPERNMHKEDSLLDQKLIKHPPVARAREYEPVNIKCRICGKTESVNPALVESVGRYKCNKCSASAG